MDFNEELFEVEFTNECINEMKEIYDYITNNLKENEAAKRLMTEVTDRILSLARNPDIYMKIGKIDRLNKIYHRMVVKNYVLLYTIDFKMRKVYISRMIYGRRDYLN